MTSQPKDHWPEIEPTEIDGAPSGTPYDWYVRGSEFLENGNSGAATILFTRLAQIDRSPTVLEGLGRALFATNQYADAVEVLTELVEIAPDNDYAHYSLGLSLWRLQQFPQARDHLAMAFVMRPERSDYGKSLAQVKATLRAREAEGLPIEGPLPPSDGTTSLDSP